MKSQTDTHVLPRTREDWVRLVRNAILVLAMGGAAFGGTAAANETRLDRVEAKVERIEYRIDRILEALEGEG